MARRRNARPGEGQRRTIKQLSLPIGIRLSLAFMIIILLTGLIGIMAIQQISSLANKAVEITTRDVPEATTIVSLRSLLYRQYDLERSLLSRSSSNGNQPSALTQPDRPTEVEHLTPVVPFTLSESQPPTTGINPAAQMKQIVAELTSVLKDLHADCQQLLEFEKSEPKDFSVLQRITDGVDKARIISERLQTLVQQTHFAQANAIEQQQQEPLLLSTIATITQLDTMEQAEDAKDTIQTQQDSKDATNFVFALTTLGLLLSIVLAILITRSLTGPLKVLLSTTEAIASGNLQVEAQVESTDEIGRLASAYEKMRLNLRSTIASLNLERQQTQAIIDATADGIILIDGAYKILKCNPASEQLSGWSTQEAVGNYCWEVLGFKETTVNDAETQGALMPLLAALHTRGEQSSLEMLITARTGQQRWLAISCAPLSLHEGDPEPLMVIGLHDISQLKTVEHMKSHFVAMVSHELRAPLTTVTSSVEMLSLLDPTTDTETYHEVVGILDQQTQRLRKVVEEVLQLTRFEAGRLDVHLEPVSLTTFLHTCVEKAQKEWMNSDHWIVFRASAEDLLVWADSGLLEIVLRNLLDNARKYTPPDTAVEIETEIMQATDQVQIRVIDHGPGIPEDQFEHIFERFSRGTHSSYHWTRGYGLGLSIARELIEAHNGTIRVENRQQGACFVLSLWCVKNDPSSVMMETE
jgi:PAS domain S-box-containing protein